MYREILFLVLGLILLVKGADFFVEASARLAKKLGVSDFIIGLTFVALGTSLPELASSVTAALAGYPLLVTGNIIGSNIANIGLIIGLAAIFKTLHTKRKMYLRLSVCAGLFIEIGFSPVELADFLLGWTTLDIADDDYKAEETSETENSAETAEELKKETEKEK